MYPQQALNIVNATFKYTPDKQQYGFKDVWRIMPRKEMAGDCEDYALTVLFLMADESVLKMLYQLLIRRTRIYHYTNIKTKSKHLGCWCRDMGYADNLSRKWNDGYILKGRGYKRFPIAVPAFIVLLKVMMGKVQQRL